MPRKKKVEDKTEDVTVDTAIQETKVAQTDESIEKKKFRALIESYKQSNPAKYEAKKSELYRQLEEMN